MDLKQSNNFHYWLWFELNNQSELYEVISAMIKDKISELLPQLIEEYMRQQFDKLSVNIETTINGKVSNNLTEDIIDMLQKQLR